MGGAAVVNIRDTVPQYWYYFSYAGSEYSTETTCERAFAKALAT